MDTLKYYKSDDRWPTLCRMFSASLFDSEPWQPFRSIAFAFASSNKPVSFSLLHSPMLSFCNTRFTISHVTSSVVHQFSRSTLLSVYQPSVCTLSNQLTVCVYKPLYSIQSFTGLLATNVCLSPIGCHSVPVSLQIATDRCIRFNVYYLIFMNVFAPATSAWDREY